MKLALFYLIFCATLFAYDVSAQRILFPVKEDMKAQDYEDRANYFAAIAAPADKGGASCFLTNTTEAGPFRIHLSYPEPAPGQNIYSISISAIMEKNAIEALPVLKRRLDVNYVWENISLGSQMPGLNDLFYEISIPSLETNWLKTDLSSKWKFASVFKFFFNSTEKGTNHLEVQIQCPITLTRPKTVQGAYTESHLTYLISTHDPINIDISISASLLPCVDSDPENVEVCIQMAERKDAQAYLLNKYGKFILFLDNNDFAGVYYLRKYRVEMKSQKMSTPADFTDGAAATEGKVTNGSMVFRLPMTIVGNRTTVSAIATLSSTGTRRMMENVTPKAIYAASNVDVFTCYTPPCCRSCPCCGFASYIFSIALFIGMILIMIES